MKTLQELFEQLESNTKRLEDLRVRVDNIKNPENKYYKIFSNEFQRKIDIEKVSQIKKRVLRMRFRVLENINSQTLKEMQKASVESRELNLVA